ncbi:MAG: hypothetical protein ACO1Q7_15915 [Gemmatimonas sp.]
MNLGQALAAALAPVLSGSVFAQFGCNITVLRKTSTRGSGNKAVHTYAPDPAYTNVSASIMDPESATRAKLWGLLDTSTAMLVIPGVVPIEQLDGIRVENGPNTGRTYVADAKGECGEGFTTHAPLRELALVIA